MKRISKNKNEKEVSLINLIFYILLAFVIIFIGIYLFVPKFRRNVNRDLQKVFKVDFDAKTKFLDKNKKDKNKVEEESEKEVEKKLKDKDEKSILEKEKNKNEDKNEIKEKTEEKKEMQEEVIKEKTPEEKALNLVNKAHNVNGTYMSYVMDKTSDSVYLVALSDPNTTNLKAVFEVNILTGEIKQK